MLPGETSDLIGNSLLKASVPLFFLSLG